MKNADGKPNGGRDDSYHLTDGSARYWDVLYRHLADALPHLVWIADADRRFRFVNQRWIDYTGHAFAESSRLSWQAFIDPEDLAAVGEMSRMARESGKPGETAARLRSRDGTHRWFLIRTVPLPPDICGADCWLGTATDIHEQRQAEDVRLFVADLDSRMRGARTPEDVLAAVVETLAARLRVTRCSFLQIDLDAEIARRFKVYSHPQGGILPAWYDRSLLPLEIQTTLMQGGTVVVQDIYTDPRTVQGEEVRTLLHARAFVAVPILRQGVHVGSLTVVEEDRARIWLPEEVTLVQIVAERTWLAMESTREFRKNEETERMRRTFAREVLFAATEGCLRICDSVDDLPEPLTGAGPVIDLREAGGLAAVRHAANESAKRLEFAEGRWCDLVLAVGEAAINTIVHGGGGMARVCDDHNGTIQVWFVDQGGGIHFDDIPRATMTRGFSTASSLGQGFKMILNTADRVYLLTDTTGTTVVIEHDRVVAQEIGSLF